MALTPQQFVAASENFGQIVTQAGDYEWNQMGFRQWLQWPEVLQHFARGRQTKEKSVAKAYLKALQAIHLLGVALEFDANGPANAVPPPGPPPGGDIDPNQNVQVIELPEYRPQFDAAQNQIVLYQPPKVFWHTVQEDIGKILEFTKQQMLQKLRKVLIWSAVYLPWLLLLFVGLVTVISIFSIVLHPEWLIMVLAKTLRSVPSYLGFVAEKMAQQIEIEGSKIVHDMVEAAVSDTVSIAEVIFDANFSQNSSKMGDGSPGQSTAQAYPPIPPFFSRLLFLGFAYKIYSVATGVVGGVGG